jgi:hypothetical protein
MDSEYNNYYIIFSNKDCRLYKETISSGLDLAIKNFEELEKFISKLENSKDINELNLIKNIKDNLLKFKDNDEEEKKRETNLTRKQQAFEKAKKLTGKNSLNELNKKNADLYLINASDHMITRHQLNQITKTTSLNNYQNIQVEKKPNLPSEQDILKIKIEKEKLARQQRLEKRQKILENNKYDDDNENEFLDDDFSEGDEKDIFIRQKRNRSLNSNLNSNNYNNNNTLNKRSNQRRKSKLK